MVISSSPMDSVNSTAANKPPALSLTLGPRGVDTAGPEVAQPQNSTAQDVSVVGAKDQESLVSDGMSPMSRYFDGDSLTPMNQKPPQFFGAPFVFGGPNVSATAIVGESSVATKRQQASFAMYEPPSGFVLRPKPSEISNTDRRQSIESAISTQSTSTASGQLIGQNEMERGSVPIAVYVDLSVLRETKKGKNALIKPNSTSRESQAIGHWGSNLWGGSENRRPAQKRNS